MFGSSIKIERKFGGCETSVLGTTYIFYQCGGVVVKAFISLSEEGI